MFLDLFKSLDEKIERDGKVLTVKLKSSDIRTLIIAMDSNEPISKNVLKKRNKGSYGSGDEVSWYAYKVSDELNDSNLKTKLMELLIEKDFSHYKKYVLICLSSLCANTNDFELYDFLIQQIKQSEEENIISSVVSRFRKLKKPSTLNIDYLKNLVVNGAYQQRLNAIRTLEGAEHEELEEILIHEFKVSDLHTKEVICANLRTTGTKKSFEVLESEYKRTRSNSLKYFIENTIKEINERENTTAN